MERSAENEELRRFQERSRKLIDGYDWQPAEIAFSQVKRFYEGSGRDKLEAEEQAQTAILRRLLRGGAFARIRNADARIMYDLTLFPGENLRKRRGSVIHWGHLNGDNALPKGVISRNFWRMLNRSGSSSLRDWHAGDFEFDFEDEKLECQVVGKLLDALISVCKLPGYDRGLDKSVKAKNRFNAAESPRLSEFALQNWWCSLDAETQRLPQTQITELCKAAFPRNSISRDRIRALDPGRKPGPKPIGEEATA